MRDIFEIFIILYLVRDGFMEWWLVVVDNDWWWLAVVQEATDGGYISVICGDWMR